MTREEAVKKLVTVGHLSVAHAEDLYDSIVTKPVVPQYVADWYEEHNDGFEDVLFQCIYDVGNKYTEEIFDKFEKWLINNEQSLTILVNMHQFGYEVEEDPRYTVRIRNLNVENCFLSYNNFNEKWLFSERYISNYSFRITHTRKELEDGGFDWVFSCEEFEVKEV